MKTRKIWSWLLLMAMALPMMVACGGDDSGSDGGGNSGGNTGGGTSTTTVNIIGTWRAYYQSKDTSRGQVYDLVTFKSDNTGSIIEEVGYGSDNAVPFVWKMTGNIIQVYIDDEIITWTIQQIIDSNTVVVHDGKKEIRVYRDGTGGGSSGGSSGGGGGSTTSFVSQGGGSLTVAQLVGTWQVYHVEGLAIENGQTYTLSQDLYPGDQYDMCRRYEFYADYTYTMFKYYENARWGVSHEHYPYQAVIGGGFNLPQEGGTPPPEYFLVTGNKNIAGEIVITVHENTSSYTQDLEYLLKRVEGSGGGTVNYSLTIDKTAVNIGAEGGSEQLTITSTDNWSITGANEWCVPSMLSGSGNSTIMLQVQKNTNNTSRTVTLTVTGTKSGIKQTVTVTQDGASSSSVGYDDYGSDKSLD